MIRTCFIGIDRYQDDSIRELTGAVRDAKALHALFTDSIVGLQGQLLTNEEATADQVRSAWKAALDEASSEDTVILSFAGHGSRSQRLVCHDTKKDSFGPTTISMAELADQFRESKAKYILCLLDCCFSGGAAARVFEDSPIPRDGEDLTLEALAGTGRVLLAASNVNEPAYEHPTSRHGLFTKALLDVLQRMEEPTSLLTVMEQVMDEVRAESERMGLPQTPVLFGKVEGGMTLPALRAGAQFHAAFPEVHGVRVSADIEELGKFNLPSELLRAWKSQYTNGLNELQLTAVNDFRILEGESLLVIAPTSSGKTFVGEIAAGRAITDGKKAVFLLPYRALVSEKYDQFQALYGEQLGMRVIRVTGDYSDQTSEMVRGKYDLALLTYEMFLSLAVSSNTILNHIGLVVFDEAQFITDPTRGISVELLLTLLIAAREREVKPQLMVLSAVIGGVNHFDAWLGCQTLITDKRPVKLVEGVIDRSGVYEFLDETGKPQTTQLVPSREIYQRRKDPSAQDVIVPLVKQLVKQGEKVIVFRNMKGKATGCGNYLAQDLGLPPATDTIRALPTADLSSASGDLRRCLEGGTAFHTTNLNREERSVVERAYRDPGSQVRVLAATTTVAAGINTPASTVILAEQEFIGDDGRKFTVAEYKNMAGRAGRLGFNEEGKSIIYAENAMQRRQLFERYVLGTVEPIQSSFHTNEIETWVLRLLTQVNTLPRQQVARLLASTYGGYLANRANPDWQKHIEARLEQLLVEMERLELVERDGESIGMTLLGRACGRSSLSFKSAIWLVDLLKAVPPASMTSERLMVLVQALPEADGGYTPVMKRGRNELVRPGVAASKYGNDIVRLLQRRAENEWEYIARCKRACILGDWIDGVAVSDIERSYSPNPFQGVIGHGEIRRFADASRFHLRSAHQIIRLIYISEGPDDESIENLLKRLEIGVPEVALPLVGFGLPTLTRSEYMTLLAASVTTAERMRDLSQAEWEGLLGQERAAEIRPLQSS